MSKKRSLRTKHPLKTAAASDADNRASLSTRISGNAESHLDALRRRSLLIEAFLVCAVIAAGIFIRLDDLRVWRRYEASTFYEGSPLHTTFDAYYYLSLAKDIIDRTYAPVDEKRGVPDCPPRPSPPPLLSVMAAGIARLTSYDLSWVGAVLPAVLAPLLVVPLYGFGRAIAGPVCGLTASLMAVLYPFYVYRSSFGRFDTDSLNITFAVGVAYLFLVFGTRVTVRRYVYFAGACLLYALFLWWWDQAPAVVTAITFLPFALALLFYYRPRRREAIVFVSLIGAAAACFIALKKPNALILMVKRIFLEYLYISKDTSGDFPNIGISISEQMRPSLDEIIAYTSVNPLWFLLSVAGIGLLLWKQPKKTLMFISLFILSILAFTYANRFLLFFVPVIALGAGGIIWFLWNLRQRFLPLYVIVPLLCCAMTWPLVTQNTASVQWPKEPASIVAGMDTARHKTPPDAVIWAWWDHGYALTYFARRATINDGSIHSGERTVYTALPYATDSFRYAANFMHFYVARGIPGIQRFCSAAGSRSAGLRLMKDVLASGPQEARSILEKANLKPTSTEKTLDDWLAFFFPRDRRPVYLFLDSLLPKITYWWYWFGTWDVERRDGTHPFFSWHSPLAINGSVISTGDGLTCDMDNGEVQISGRRLSIATAAVRDRNAIREKNFYNQSPYCLEVFEPGRFGALMEKSVANTVFNRLYIRHTPDQQYFKPVALAAPAYQLWEVTGDTLPAS